MDITQTEIGKIPEDWEIVKLGKVANFETGKLDSHYAEENGKYPFFTCSPNPLKINSYSFDCEAVLLAGNNANGIFHLNYYNGKFDVYQRTYVVTPKDRYLNLKYLYFHLYLTLNLLKDISQGTATKFLTKRILNDLEIVLPPIEEQKRIADILWKLNSKISLNQCMNKTLEAIAQAIFKHWFVDFEFPNEEGKPYKSSGGEMVYNEELGKEIPKGWEVVEIRELGEIICGKTPPKSIKKYFGGDMPFIKIPDIHNEVFVIETDDSLTEEGMNSQKNKTIPPYSVCVSCIATVGKVCINDKKSQTNQQINSIVPKESYFTYYLYFKMKSMEDYLKVLGSGGSATLNINTRIFSKIKILKPEDEILREFQEKVDPLFDKILSNLYQSKSLSQIRDTLLPKLMSGDIRVKVDEVENEVRDAEEQT